MGGMGALSRKEAEGGMNVGDLANYLKVSRQNLSGLIGRMERDGHIELAADTQDRRAKRVSMTENGRHVWEKEAQPKIRAYYESALVDFSTGDLTHTLHYLLKLLDNMEKIDLKSHQAKNLSISQRLIYLVGLPKTLLP
jgi:DNA-binding MarR family transcriptional regulator